jgi:membrane-bound ClpP family serine protease
MKAADPQPRLQRPLAVTVISLIYIVVGIVGLVFHLVDFKGQLSLRSEITWITAVRLLAIVAGIDHNWARWLALAWMAFHVVLGALNAPSQLLLHAFLLVVFGYFLLCRQSANHFRPPRKPKRKVIDLPIRAIFPRFPGLLSYSEHR